jgi:glycosyltransferase involved in cell wall biosynthesis
MRRLFQLLEVLSVEHIAISRAVYTHLVQDIGINPGRISVVYYGMPAVAPLARHVVQQFLGLPLDRFLVGFVGRLTPQKQVHLLIDALAQLPEALGVLIGEGELRAELEARAARYEVKNIRFLGYQPQAIRLMPAFDLLCLPSAWEGLGLVLVEAMLQGVPVCGSRAGAIPEVLDNGNAGLLVAPDGSDLAAVLRHAMEHPARLAELGIQGREYALRQFTVDAMVQQTLAVYQRASKQ